MKRENPYCFNRCTNSITNILSDGHAKLILDVEIAKSGHKGVFVAFKHKILVGSRAIKVRTANFNVFE